LFIGGVDQSNRRDSNLMVVAKVRRNGSVLQKEIGRGRHLPLPAPASS
jgi:hypothetical protein